jgi:hypothetical protein
MSAQNRSNNEPYRGVSLVLVAILVLPIAFHYGPLLILQDFSIYLYATVRWLAGASPYELPDTASHVGGTIGGLNSYINVLKVWAPPYFLCMMIPFAALGITSGKVLYLACLLSSLAGWTLLTARELAAKFVIRRGWDNARLLALALIASPWCVTHSTVMWGGMSLLAGVAFLILATCRSFASFPRWFLFWSLVSIKPHAILGAAVAFMVLLPSRERWRSLSALCAVGFLIVLLLLLHSPDVWDQFLALDSSVAHNHQPSTQTLMGRLLMAGMSVDSSYLVTGALWLISLFPLVKMRRASMSFREIVAVSLLFNVTSIYLSPYAWMHDYQSALGLLWATLVVGTRSGRLAVVSISLLLALNLVNIFSALFFSKGQWPELTFWSVCAAFLATWCWLVLLWISKYSERDVISVSSASVL